MMLKSTVLSALVFLLFTGCGGFRGLSVGSPEGPSQATLPLVPDASFTLLRVTPQLSSNNFIARFKVPSNLGFPWFEAVGSDGNVWFTEQSAPNVGRITPAGLFKEFPIPGGVRGAGIAAGAPGLLWFADATKIGRVTTGGAITVFTVPGALRHAVGITKGPDGNMWFADTAGAVGRISPTGVIKEFAVPTTGSSPQGITAGSDGNLWFTEATAVPSKIGKITPTAHPAITEFVLPTHAANPNAIIVGPDGNLYVAETGASNLARVTTAGLITEFHTPSGAIQALAVGPDNQIWMTFHNQGFISEFNTTTHVFSPPIVIPNGPISNIGLSLALGMNGDMWMGDSNDMIDVYEESIQPVGARLIGETPVTDPHYGRILGYFNGTTSTTSQVVTLTTGETVQFSNVDGSAPHTVSFLGNATATHAPWPASFNGSATKSPAGTAINAPNFSTGPLNPGQKSLVYEAGSPGFYMMGCFFHYDGSGMRTVIIVR